MKQIIKCKNFYQDIDALSALISSLEFEDTLYGKEVINFPYIPQGLQDFIQSVLNEEIEIQPDTGLFRKPSSMIHFDNFYQHALWTCVVAIEDTNLHLHTHKEGYETFFDIKPDINQFFIEEAIKPESWTTNTTMSIKRNEFVFIRPWVWKSFDTDKLVQTFLLNAKIGT